MSLLNLMEKRELSASRPCDAGKRLFLWGNQLRVAHWGKNLLVFFPLFYYGRGFILHEVIRAFWLFFVFCLLSSGVYLINDLADLRSDRLHPFKKLRPLASGCLGGNSVLKLSIVLLISSISAAFFIDGAVFTILCVYLINALAYTFLFKKTAFLDIFSIEVGFILRLAAGAVIANYRINPIFFICIFFSCLFFILAKRRAELSLLQDSHVDPSIVRGALFLYGQEALDKALPVSAVISILAYFLFVFGIFVLYPRIYGYLLLSTVPLVAYCFLTYSKIIISGEKSGLVRVVFRYKKVLGAAVAWALIFGLIILQQ
ncbi:MAG: UbiA prenyltransferase family protein [Candidatus Omnitrophota bacterium]